MEFRINRGENGKWSWELVNRKSGKVMLTSGAGEFNNPGAARNAIKGLRHTLNVAPIVVGKGE